MGKRLTQNESLTAEEVELLRRALAEAEGAQGAEGARSPQGVPEAAPAATPRGASLEAAPDGATPALAPALRNAVESLLAARLRDLGAANDEAVTLREEMEETLRRQTVEFHALLETGSAIAASIDYDDVLCRVTRAAGEALETAECVIWEYREDTDLGVFRCLWEREPVPGLAVRLVGASYPISSHAGGAAALRAGTIVQQCRSDPDLPPEDARDMDDWGERTWLTVPLVFDQRLLGVMTLVETERERRFDADEVRMAAAIGEQAAVALNNALRHRREEERNRWLQALVGVARAIPAARDPDASLVEVARQATRALQSPAAFVYEYAPDRDALLTRARSAARPTGRDHPVGLELPVGDAPGDRRALDDGELVVETISDPELDPRVRERMHGNCEKTLLKVPLRRKGEALGLLVVIEDEEERLFTADELDFMSAFGEQVTLALTTARSATMDGLTNLANHRFFYERLGNELARGQRYSTPVSLLMIDIDDFKELNDTFGHPAGDQALRQIGRLLAGSLRHGVDTPARYGGEEFAVILPNTKAGAWSQEDHEEAARPVKGGPASGHYEGAVALAERLREAVADAEFPVAVHGQTVHLTVSIGVATFPDMAGTMRDLVGRADAALYAAKRAGKNRVKVYGHREPTAPSASR